MTIFAIAGYLLALFFSGTSILALLDGRYRDVLNGSLALALVIAVFTATFAR